MPAFWGKDDVQLHNDDALAHLQQLESESIDLIVTSPPYNIGKDYESVVSLEKYLDFQESIIKECLRVLKPEGNLCWQVGFTKVSGEILPLDALFLPIFRNLGFKLKNRIVWTFGHGMHAKKRFSGRHETILWFSKSLEDAYFDLDSVRTPQKYPEKRHYKGPKKGEISGHPLGKNPGDVWDIPNVKAHHVEKTEHQCQFPVALVQRLIRGLSPEGGIVLDPYSGVGTTACAAIIEGRRAIGIERDSKYHTIAQNRVSLALDGRLEIRPLEKPIQAPNGSKGQNKNLRGRS